MRKGEADISEMTLSGLNLIKQALSIYDSDLALVLANRRFQDMFNIPDDLVKRGSSFEATVRHLAEAGEYGEVGDIDAFVAERVDQARTFQPHYFERTRSNGSTIAIEGSPLRQGGWVAVYTDITEVKSQEALLRVRSDNLSERLIARSEELARANRALTATVSALEETKRELIASQDRLNLINAMTPAHIARVGRDGVYTYSNGRLASVIPNRPSDVVGLHLSEALGASVFQSVKPALERAMEGEAPVLELEDPDSGHHLRVAFTPDRAEDGRIRGAYILSTDMTEEVTARNALQHSRRRELAAQLTSGLAHDFSNLLTIILGQVERLDAEAGHSPATRESIDTIRSAARRGGVLLEGLSRIDGRRVLKTRATDMAAFADGIARLAQGAMPEGIALEPEVSLPDPHLMIDPGFAQDAILNLVLNAIEATEPPGAIRLTIGRARGDRLEIRVTDSGSGFSEEALKHALAPFYTSKTDKPGRGLGLATAFDFARLSGGRLRLANNADGPGASVTILLPYLPARPVAPGMVLLVDDRAEIRETVRGYLRRMGHAVIEASDAGEAARLARMPEVTHIITDLVLGDGPSGLDLARDLRASGIELPILVITGQPPGNPERKETARQFPILQKPFSYDDLAAHFYQGAQDDP